MPVGIEAGVVLVATAIWIGAALPPLLVVVGAACAVGRSRGVVPRRLMAVVVVAGALGAGVGTMHGARMEATMQAPLPEGRVGVVGVAVGDPLRSRVVVAPQLLDTGTGWVPWRGPDLLLSDPPDGIMAGEPLVVRGVVEDGVSRFRGSPVGGVIDGRAERLGPAANPLLRLGNLVRSAVLGHLDAVRSSPPGALLAGFLIGDVSALPTADAEALRRSGLSHFVAVSGSNVALFLGAWWVVTGPLGLGPRRRAVLGIAGVIVFAVVTRWEPSVVRASVMAGAVLGARLFGRSVSPWTALGGAVGVSILAAPGLVASVGFSLSVAATAGIIAGIPVWRGRSPAPVWAVMGATISAQIAVAPLLLIWFGSIPLVAPLTNLVAAPLVAAATALGGVGAVCGVGVLVDLGAAIAAVVLAVARVAADLPHLDWLGSIVLGALMLGAVRFPTVRPVVVLVVVAHLVAAMVPPLPPTRATAHFLDIGQGDAAVILDPSGGVVVIDGGPDPGPFRDHLSRLGVRRIDLLVVSHRHADHAAGLVGITEQAAVGMVWHPPQVGAGGAFDAVIDEVAATGAVVMVPRPGDTVAVGTLGIVAVAPLRRYADPNDGSLVVVVSDAMGASVVMAGDIGAVAQQDLGPLRGDIMKVPHQGAATSDLAWLALSAPRVAVVSVGPNDFGHPSAAVIATLEQAGAIVLRTDQVGTVSLPLPDAAVAATALASRG